MVASSVDARIEAVRLLLNHPGIGVNLQDEVG
jgi:hypothetical protein